MEGTTPRGSGLAGDISGRLSRVGALAALLTAGANAVVFAVASSLFGAVVIAPHETVPLVQVVGASVAGSIGAAVVFGVFGRYARHPVRIFRGVAGGGLLLSFVPIALAGATGHSAATLALMHVVAVTINVGLLTRLGRKE
jgi:hypothetical protein